MASRILTDVLLSNSIGTHLASGYSLFLMQYSRKQQIRMATNWLTAKMKEETSFGTSVLQSLQILIGFHHDFV